MSPDNAIYQEYLGLHPLMLFFPLRHTVNDKHREEAVPTYCLTKITTKHGHGICFYMIIAFVIRAPQNKPLTTPNLS